jgi:hypothetical protein
VKWSRLASVAAFGVLVTGLAGCGGESGPKYVKVSGVVKIDGVPFDDGVVVFAPKGSKDSTNPGSSSSGYTDKDGRFILHVQNDGREGAVVGTHLVRIMSKGDQIITIDPKVGSPDNPKLNMMKPNKVPKEWSTESTKEFTVPPEGTDQANFDITTKPQKK